MRPPREGNAVAVGGSEEQKLGARVAAVDKIHKVYTPFPSWYWLSDPRYIPFPLT